MSVPVAMYRIPCLFIQILTIDPKICPPPLWLCWLFLAQTSLERIYLMKLFDALC